MDLFSELITTVQSDLKINDDSTLYPLTAVKLALNRSYRKAGGLFLWPETEDAKKTSTVANQEYYDYPQNWRPDSVWKLEVDGEDYDDPLVFKDYLLEIEDDFPNGIKNIWSSQWRRFFIRTDGVAPTTNGTNNISVWGQKVVDPLVNLTDTTIFSYSMPECNDAIVLEAEAILKATGNEEKAGEFRSQEAKKILVIAWTKIAASQSKYEKVRPFFDVPDMFAHGVRKTKIGDFD